MVDIDKATGTHMVTTIDNPWNPWTDWDEWYSWDQAHGYHTLPLLARVARTSDELSEADYEAAIELAVREIAKFNVSGMHIMVPDPRNSGNSAA